MAAIATAMAASLALASPASGSEAGVTQLAGWPTLAAGETVVPVRLTRQDRPAGSAGARLEMAFDFDAPPGVRWRVSLRAPNGRRARVGILDFSGETGPVYPGMGTPSRTFDATGALRGLGGEVDALVFQAMPGLTRRGPHARPAPAGRIRFAAWIAWR